MRYALLLRPHSNARYRESLKKLAVREAQCLLEAWQVPYSDMEIAVFEGEDFLFFDAPPLEPDTLHALGTHSGICLAAEMTEQGTLRVLRRNTPGLIPPEMPHVLKYKGKTNPDFTCLMLHCAKAASAFAKQKEGLTVMDPMCGKGTGLFCALCENNHAVGIETDGKALQEADTFTERFLQMNRLKYQRGESAARMAGSLLRKTHYDIAASAQAQKEGQALHLDLIHADAAEAGPFIKKGSCHLVICDLPYGVQHAPKEKGGVSTLIQLTERVLPVCANALLPGGAAAFAFNLNTLKRQDLEKAMTHAGLTVLTDDPYNDFSHWVEQAVDRDMVIGIRIK